MKSKVLLICNYFAPDHTIGAVRTSKLAKYLRNSGYEVEVLTEKKKGEEDELLKNDIKGIPIYYTENSKRFIGCMHIMKSSYNLIKRNVLINWIIEKG